MPRPTPSSVGDRGQRIASLLGLKDPKKDVLKSEVGCVGCHAMDNLANENERQGRRLRSAWPRTA